MEQPIRGGCACGGIRYECSQKPLVTLNCHCRDCQRSSGTAFSTVIAVPAAGVKLIVGTPKYHAVAIEGVQIERGFCPECGTPLFGRNRDALELLVIKIGSLDDPSQFKPQVDIWTKSAQPWTLMSSDTRKFPKDFPTAP